MKMTNEDFTVKIEAFDIKKLSQYYNSYDPILLDTTESPYRLGLIFFENKSTKSVWLRAEKKYNVFFYHVSEVREFDENNYPFRKIIQEISSNCNIEILPKSSKCFVTHLFDKKKGIEGYQEYSIGYRLDTMQNSNRGGILEAYLK